ncbi:MAG: hypothetical protein RL235_1187 [Chlamydiota bacterium]
MRRSFCVCEPAYALAGDRGHWKFAYTTATPLAKGAKLKFDLGSQGAPLEWEIPSVSLKDKGNVIWAELSDEKPISAAAVEGAQGVAFEFVLTQEVKSGERITIHIGARDKNTSGNACQKMVQRKRPFHLFIDPKGKGEYKESETFHLDVRGNLLKTLRVIAPSVVNRGKRFDVIVRFEDMYGNLTSNAPEGTLIDLSYEHLRENLSWKLFVPETGFIALPNLYFNEAGVYKIQLKNLQNKQTFFSTPIKCLPEGALGLYWGSLHSESERFDSAEGVEAYLRHMRDDRALQFVATSSFESEEETPTDVWKEIVAQVAEFNEDDRFVAFLGFQWKGEAKQEGLRQFIYSKDAKGLLRHKDNKNNALKKIYKTNSPKEMMAIPSFTMGKETCYDFVDFDPEFEKVVEIYNAWGSSECTAKEGNLRPIRGGKINETAEGSIIHALNQGRRFGFIAGGYDDRGPYSHFFDDGQTQYTPGITAILAKEHSRASLFEALQARSCYATTGERIILGLQIAGQGIGSELDTKSRPGLEFNRHIIGYAIGTSPLEEIALIRNGKVIQRFQGGEEKVEFTIDDQESLSQLALEPSEAKPPFAYYYLRVMQKDGHIGWSSPIWIDVYSKTSAAPARKLKKKAL